MGDAAANSSVARMGLRARPMTTIRELPRPWVSMETGACGAPVSCSIMWFMMA